MTIDDRVLARETETCRMWDLKRLFFIMRAFQFGQYSVLTMVSFFETLPLSNKDIKVSTV